MVLNPSLFQPLKFTEIPFSHFLDCNRHGYLPATAYLDWEKASLPDVRVLQGERSVFSAHLCIRQCAPTHFSLSHSFCSCRTYLQRTLQEVTSQDESCMLHPGKVLNTVDLGTYQLLGAYFLPGMWHHLFRTYTKFRSIKWNTCWWEKDKWVRSSNPDSENYEYLKNLQEQSMVIRKANPK